MLGRINKPLTSGFTTVPPRARNIVREILQSLPAGRPGLSSQDIYQIALEKYPASPTSLSEVQQPHPPPSTQIGYLAAGTPTLPPHPEHPIRSMRFLKKFVLEGLMAANEVEKVHVRRGGGGLDEEGNARDSLKRPGALKTPLPPGFRLQKKEAWLWRLKPAENSEEPTQVQFEDEMEEALLGQDGWGEILRFKNVPNIAEQHPVNPPRHILSSIGLAQDRQQTTGNSFRQKPPHS